ncbi:MAG TPA: hypothetical protein VFN70_18130 [Burkholderiales bacterium]|nr:hypothetical protein [Burkholderiales bacterium]
MSVRDVLIESAAAAAGMVIKRFLDEEPTVEEKAEAGKRLLKQAIALIPKDQLVPFLTSEDAEIAEAVFRAAKAAKLAGKR